MSLGLIACQDQSASNSKLGDSHQGSPIVGGQTAVRENFGARSVVLIYGEDEQLPSYVCTGTFISSEYILTAKHCVGSGKDSISIFYNLAPFEGSENLLQLKVKNVVLYEQRNGSTAHRDDLAMIQFEGGLPNGAIVAEIPSLSPLITAESLRLQALGYGRTNGAPREDATDFAGAGILRTVEIIVPSLDPRKNTFTVDQRKGQGVCFGDSGGPGFIRQSQTENPLLIGVASGVSGSQADPCSETSLYMNILFYRDWIFHRVNLFQSL